MDRRSRILIVTTALVLAGLVSGAASGVAAMIAAMLLYLRVLPDARLLALSAGLGATIGAVALPVLGWAALRTVPLRAAVIGTSLGAALGGAIGLLVGAGSVNPYVPFSVSRSPFPECAMGAVAGAAFAAAALHVWSRRATLRAAAG
jgi:hypothetical protein